MAGTTPIYGLPYPQSSDLVSAYPALGQDLAEDLDGILAAKANYPSGGTDGQALVKSGTTTAWANAGGLVYITSGTASGASSLSLSSCMSSTYDQYLLVFRLTACSADGNVTLRLRSGSTDAASQYGYAASGMKDNGNASTLNGASQTSVALITTDGGSSASSYSGAVTFFGPAIASITTGTYHTIGITTDGLNYVSYAGGWAHAANTAYDGLTLIAAGGGTFSLTARLYGYQNA